MTIEQFENQVVTLDAGCAERSCACYSPQFGDTDGVPYYPESIVRQQQAEIEALKAHPVKELTDEVKDALNDALSGWKYIRHSHGDLYGVGWDRVQDKLEAILRKAQEK